jgi:hypothetical protein
MSPASVIHPEMRGDHAAAVRDRPDSPGPASRLRSRFRRMIDDGAHHLDAVDAG